MLLPAVEIDVVTAFADDFSNGLARVELAAQLIEVANLKVGAQLDRPLLRLELTEQNSQ